MANRITAINSYRPKLALLPTIALNELVEFISSRTGLNKGELQIALAELSTAVQFYNKRGHGVKLPGLGTYLPSIDTAGKISVSHRLDREIENALNAPGAVTAQIINRQNIGKTSDEYIALWNADHPDDPVTT